MTVCKRACDRRERCGAHDELERIGGPGFVVVNESEDGHVGSVGHGYELECLADFGVLVCIQVPKSGDEGVQNQGRGACFSCPIEGRAL
jgi:hypothetical protein